MELARSRGEGEAFCGVGVGVEDGLRESAEKR